MANSYITVQPCALDEFIEAAIQHGFIVTDEAWSDGVLEMCGLLHDDGRGCYAVREEQAEGGLTHVGCMNDPKVPGYEMDVDADW